MNKLFNAPLTLDLQFFAEGDDNPTPETNPNGEAPAETKVEATETPVKTFTQAELDEIVAKRLERAGKKFADYEELKTKAAEYEAKLEEQRLAEMSEKERAEELAKKYEAEKAELAAQLEAIRKQAQDEKIRNEFIKVATSANIAYLDDAIALADLSAVTIDESGKVVGVDEVVQTLVDNKPFLVAQKKAQVPIGAPTNGGNTVPQEKPAEQILEELKAKARKSGRIEDRIAYDKARKQFGK